MAPGRMKAFKVLTVKTWYSDLAAMTTTREFLAKEEND